MALQTLIFYRQTWVGIMDMLNRYQELKELVLWARRRKLLGPQRAYQWQLQKTILALIGYKAHFPTLMKWAFRTHRLAALLRFFTVERSYFKKGSAAGYRLQPG